MAAVYPISTLTDQVNAPRKVEQKDQFGKDTFLKLLVAQLKYQDPSRPADSSQFLQQTAQFTELETLQKIQAAQESMAKASSMLAASSMVGRNVTYALNGGRSQAPTGTSIMQVRGTLPKDVATGTHVSATSDVFTRSGTKINLKLDFVKTETGWTVQAMNGGQSLGSPVAITFDGSGSHSGNVLIPASALNQITQTIGDWPPTGIALAFGDSNDPTRLQMSSGPATVTVFEQNGNDGTKANGVVTGMKITADGPQLVVGGQDIPYTSITDVHA